MKNKKKISLRKIYNEFLTPALILHEFLHFIFVKITGSEYKGIEVAYDKDYDNNSAVEIAVVFVPRNRFSEILICMAPFLGIFLWLIPFFLGFTITYMVMLAYTLLSIHILTPSKV